MKLTHKNDERPELDFLNKEIYSRHPEGYKALAYISADRSVMIMPGVFRISDPDEDNRQRSYLFKITNSGYGEGSESIKCVGRFASYLNEAEKAAFSLISEGLILPKPWVS